MDDSSHYKKKNIENDYKKNEIFNALNIELLRIKTNQVDEKLIELREILNNHY